jgi:hypothetical protein
VYKQLDQGFVIVKGFRYQYLYTRAKRIMHTLTYKSDTTRYIRLHLDSGILAAKLIDPPTACASATLPRLTISTDPQISQHLACTLRRVYNAGIGLLSNPESLHHNGETLDLDPLPADHGRIFYKYCTETFRRCLCIRTAKNTPWRPTPGQSLIVTTTLQNCRQYIGLFTLSR